jgi:hypothetical protein
LTVPHTVTSLLSAIDCRSSSKCTAVGDPSLAIRWNGTAWRTEPVPN